MILMTLEKKKKKKSCLLTLDMLETLLPVSVQIVIMHRDSPCTCHNCNVTTSEYDWVGSVLCLCLKICLIVLLLLILLDFGKTSDAEMLMKYLKQTK